MTPVGTVDSVPLPLESCQVGLAQHRLWGWGERRRASALNPQLPSPITALRTTSPLSGHCLRTDRHGTARGAGASLGFPEPHENLEALGFRDRKWLHQVTRQVDQTPSETKTRPFPLHHLPCGAACPPLPEAGETGAPSSPGGPAP